MSSRIKFGFRKIFLKSDTVRCDEIMKMPYKSKEMQTNATEMRISIKISDFLLIFPKFDVIIANDRRTPTADPLESASRSSKDI